MDAIAIAIMLIGLVVSLFSKNEKKKTTKNSSAHHVHNVSASDEPLFHETLASGGESGKPSLSQRFYQSTRREQERRKADRHAQMEKMREAADIRNRAADRERQRQEERRKAAEKQKKDAEKAKKEAYKKKYETEPVAKDNKASSDDISAAAMFDQAMKQTTSVEEIDISGCLEDVYDKMVCGYTPSLPVQRDFIAEAEDMLSRYTL